ncbi:MAG: imidazole glycerol phosphate synthase subunit HisH [Actinomycetota bacterium]
MKVAVLDHGMGNLRSVAKALEAAGATVEVTSQQRAIQACDALCVPGQGIFGRCMTNLGRLQLTEVVRAWVDEERPYLGICLGMQVLFETSEEAADAPAAGDREGAAVAGGKQDGLGILGGEVRRLPGSVRVPHIGWNSVAGEYYYFDHSYAAFPTDGSIVTGWCDYGDRFAAEVRHGSILGVQFHPEKSARAGIELLETWVSAA